MKALLAALLLVGCAHVHNDYRLPPQTKTVRFERALPRDLVALDKAIAWWGKRGIAGLAHTSTIARPAQA